MSTKRKFTGPQRRIMKKARSDPYYSSPAAMRGVRNAGARRKASFLSNTQKFYDTALVGAAIPAPTGATGGEMDPATVLTLSAPARGDSEQERDGDRMIIKSCYVNGVVAIPAQADQTAADIACNVMVALVLDTQTNGTQLNSEDVYTNPSGNGITSATPLRNLQYTTRFRVLSTDVIRFDQPSMTFDGTNIEQGGVTMPFKLSFRGDIPVQFLSTASGAGVSGVVNNSLHVVAFASTTAVAPQISYNSRIRFQG